MDPRPKVVGIRWAVECVEQRQHVDEEGHLIDLEHVDVAGHLGKVRVWCWSFGEREIMGSGSGGTDEVYHTAIAPGEAKVAHPSAVPEGEGVRGP